MFFALFKFHKKVPSMIESLWLREFDGSAEAEIAMRESFDDPDADTGTVAIFGTNHWIEVGDYVYLLHGFSLPRSIDELRSIGSHL